MHNIVIEIQDISLSRNDNNISWSHRLINTENNSATLISQIPGEGNRRHYHPNWNEWWYIIKGQWLWEIEGEEFLINEGDIVFIEKNKKTYILNAIKRLENTDEEKYISRAMHCRGERKVGRM